MGKAKQADAVAGSHTTRVVQGVSKMVLSSTNVVRGMQSNIVRNGGASKMLFSRTNAARGTLFEWRSLENGPFSKTNVVRGMLSQASPTDSGLRRRVGATSFFPVAPAPTLAFEGFRRLHGDFALFCLRRRHGGYVFFREIVRFGLNVLFLRPREKRGRARSHPPLPSTMGATGCDLVKNEVAPGRNYVRLPEQITS